jgi:hypothetical protein
MAYPDAQGIDGGTYFLGGTLRGPEVIPGQYKVKISFGDQSATEGFEVKGDPRVRTTLAEYRKQLDLLLNARDKLSATSDAINQIHNVELQVAAVEKQAAGNAAVLDSARELEDELNAVLHKLYEPRFTGYDDQTLIYPLQLNNRVGAMQSYAGGDYGPTDQDVQAFAAIEEELEAQLTKLKQALDVDLPALNLKLKQAGISPVAPTNGTKPSGGN